MASITSVPKASVIIPGIKNEFYVANVADVATFPDLAIDATTTATNITFDSGKGFATIAISHGSGSCNSVMVGEQDSMTPETTFTAKLPAGTTTADGFLGQAANANLILIYEDKLGDFYLVGRVGTPAKLKGGEQKSGGLVTEEANTMVTIVADTFFKVKYTGTITKI